MVNLLVDGADDAFNVVLGERVVGVVGVLGEPFLPVGEIAGLVLGSELLEGVEVVIVSWQVLPDTFNPLGPAAVV